jgi:hypothetical protein
LRNPRIACPHFVSTLQDISKLQIAIRRYQKELTNLLIFTFKVPGSNDRAGAPSTVPAILLLVAAVTCDCDRPQARAR